MHIYKFTNTVNNKVYIGQTIQKPTQRFYEHCNGGYKLYKAIKKYGKEKFTFEVIDNAKTLEELNIKEEKYIAKYNSIKQGYNIRQGGNNKTHNKESIKKMRKSQRETHARRRAEGRDTFVKTRKTAGWLWSDGQKDKLKGLNTWSKGSKMPYNHNGLKGKSWKIVDGKRVYFEKEAVV